MKKNNVKKILVIYDNSENAFLFWDSDDKFKGKKFTFKDSKLIKEKKVRIDDDILTLLNDSFNYHNKFLKIVLPYI